MYCLHGRSAPWPHAFGSRRRALRRGPPPPCLECTSYHGSPHLALRLNFPRRRAPHVLLAQAACPPVSARLTAAVDILLFQRALRAKTQTRRAFPSHILLVFQGRDGRRGRRVVTGCAQTCLPAAAARPLHRASLLARTPSSPRIILLFVFCSEPARPAQRRAVAQCSSWRAARTSALHHARPHPTFHFLSACIISCNPVLASLWLTHFSPTVVH